MHACGACGDIESLRFSRLQTSIYIQIVASGGVRICLCSLAHFQQMSYYQLCFLIHRVLCILKPHPHASQIHPPTRTHPPERTHTHTHRRPAHDEGQLPRGRRRPARDSSARVRARAADARVCAHHAVPGHPRELPGVLLAAQGVCVCVLRPLAPSRTACILV